MNTKSMLYVAKKIDNDLVAIGKSKVTLRLNKPAYVAMYILDLSKVFGVYTISIMIALKINVLTNQD